VYESTGVQKYRGTGVQEYSSSGKDAWMRQHILKDSLLHGGSSKFPMCRVLRKNNKEIKEYNKTITKLTLTYKT
jgi:hypothetical protein